VSEACSPFAEPARPIAALSSSPIQQRCRPPPAPREIAKRARFRGDLAYSVLRSTVLISTSGKRLRTRDTRPRHGAALANCVVRQGGTSSVYHSRAGAVRSAQVAIWRCGIRQSAPSLASSLRPPQAPQSGGFLEQMAPTTSEAPGKSEGVKASRGNARTRQGCSITRQRRSVQCGRCRE
jgi:hypothetical protein